MNKKSWLIVGVVVLIAFGIYYYNSDVGLSPRVGTSERVVEINILDSFERGVSPSPKDVPKLERIAKSGALSGAQRAVARGFDACDADLDKNGVVDNGDLLIVVGDWGCLENGGGNETNGTISCSGEINGDGLVGTNDLLIVLDNWGESCVSPLPDLVIKDLNWIVGNDTNSTGNYFVDFTIEVKNIGEADVLNWTRTWFSIENLSSNLLWTPPILAGDSKNAYISYNISSPGTYLAEVYADYLNGVKETNEENNNWTSFVTIP